MLWFSNCIVFSLVLWTISSPVIAQESEKNYFVFGWMEEAAISRGGYRVHAKLDTGADTSSMHAENLEVFKRNSKDWVRFEITNRYGEKARIEKRVRRFADIKRKQGKPQKRPVVKLEICVGSIRELVEFTLVDRSNFSSTALIGRNFLSGKILVDSSVSYSMEPDCKFDS